MLTNEQAPKFSGPGSYLLAVLVIAITIIITWNYEYTSEQNKTTGTEIYTAEIQRTNTPAQQQIKPVASETNFDKFIPALEQTQQRIIDYNSTTESSISNQNLLIEENFSQNDYDAMPPDAKLEEAQHAQKETEYQQLISDFNQVKGDDKVLLLEELWRLSPEVGIDENLLTLLHLAAYDTDINVRKVASIILSDLQRYNNGELSPEEQLVSQISEINHNQQSLTASLGNDEQQIFDQPKINRNDNTTSSAEVTQQKSKKIEQLTELALNSENRDTKEYALMNLVELDHDSALDVIQYKLLYSNNSDERFKALELLKSSIGNVDIDKIRQILILASNNYDTVTSEYASTTLIILNNYTQAQNDIRNNIGNSQLK